MYTLPLVEVNFRSWGYFEVAIVFPPWPLPLLHSVWRMRAGDRSGLAERGLS